MIKEHLCGNKICGGAASHRRSPNGVTKVTSHDECRGKPLGSTRSWRATDSILGYGEMAHHPPLFRSIFMIQWTRSGIGDATRTYMELDSRGGILFPLGLTFQFRVH